MKTVISLACLAFLGAEAKSIYPGRRPGIKQGGFAHGSKKGGIHVPGRGTAYGEKKGTIYKSGPGKRYGSTWAQTDAEADAEAQYWGDYGLGWGGYGDWGYGGYPYGGWGGYYDVWAQTDSETEADA